MTEGWTTGKVTGLDEGVIPFTPFKVQNQVSQT